MGVFFEEKQNVTHMLVLFKIDYYIDKLMNVISVYCFVWFSRRHAFWDVSCLLILIHTTHLVFVYILYEGVSRILSCMFRNFTTISDFLIQHILKVFSNPLNWLTLRHLLQKIADCSKISDNMKKKLEIPCSCVI